MSYYDISVFVDAKCMSETKYLLMGLSSANN